MSPEDVVMMRAREIAINAHRGQVDKAGRDYYRTHVADVAHRVGLDRTLRAVAYLHDVVEDTTWTLDALAHVGFPGEVLAAVDAITHRPHENRLTYYARVKANPLALAVKLADIASNSDPDRLAMLPPSTRTRLIDKYERAKSALLDGPDHRAAVVSGPRTPRPGVQGHTDTPGHLSGAPRGAQRPRGASRPGLPPAVLDVQTEESA